jgi:hypothetical protein
MKTHQQRALARVTRLPEATAFMGPFDAAVLASMDYHRKIAPAVASSLATVKQQLESGARSTPAFVAALRGVFLNALRFNGSDELGGYRTAARACLAAVDDAVLGNAALADDFLVRSRRPYTRSTEAFPEAPAAMAALERLLAEKRPRDGLPLATPFVWPPESYFAPGEFPVDYRQYVPEPTSLADVSAALYGGEYPDVASFAAHVRRVFANAITYFADSTDPENAAVAADAAACRAFFDSALSAETARLAARRAAAATPPMDAATIRLCAQALDAAAGARYRSLLTNTDILLGGTFSNTPAEVLAGLEGYAAIVRNPIDLPKIRDKLTAARDYASPGELAADVLLMTTNCQAFNNTPASRDYWEAAAAFWRAFAAAFAARFPALPLPAQPASYPQPGIVVSSRTPGAVGGVLPLSSAAATAAASRTPQTAAGGVAAAARRRRG